MEDDPLTGKIIAAAMEVHSTLGPGLLESVYELALCHEFDLRGIAYQRQAPVKILYKDATIAGQVVDILVENKVVLELKAVRKLPEIAYAQTLSYLKATGLSRALLLNFGERRMAQGIKRFSL
jgi:GxxExxY protein